MRCNEKAEEGPHSAVMDNAGEPLSHGTALAVNNATVYVSNSQDAEKVYQRRSRPAQRLNVPKRTPRLFARCGLAG